MSKQTRNRKRNFKMTRNFRLVTLAVPALAIVGALAPAAQAGSGDTSQIQAPFVFNQTGSNAQALVLRAKTAADAIAAGNAMHNTASIVGMWRIQFLSLGNTAHTPPIPDGAQIDFGYTQWHSDGTELMNSGGHAANTGNFCTGVWVRSGYFTYELNHFALSYDPTSGNLTAKVNIREQVTLDPSGNEFSGTFVINGYNPTTGVQVDHVVGTISARRITVDDTTP
jgi:hypothetical protein